MNFLEKKEHTPVLVVTAVLILVGAVRMIFPAETPERMAQVVLIACASQQDQKINKETCYAKQFFATGEKFGYEFSFAALQILQKQDPDAQGCNLIAHGIGSGAY